MIEHHNLTKSVRQHWLILGVFCFSFLYYNVATDMQRCWTPPDWCPYLSMTSSVSQLTAGSLCSAWPFTASDSSPSPHSPALVFLTSTEHCKHIPALAPLLILHSLEHSVIQQVHGFFFFPESFSPMASYWDLTWLSYLKSPKHILNHL